MTVFSFLNVLEPDNISIFSLQCTWRKLSTLVMHYIIISNISWVLSQCNSSNYHLYLESFFYKYNELLFLQRNVWLCSAIDILRRNGTPLLFDVLPFEINIENYFLLIGIICTLFGNFPRSSVC